MVRCTITLSSRACIQINSAATRYSPSASSRVRPTAAKSTPRPGTTFMPDSRSAKVLSPRARAAAMACSLVMPGGQLAADHAVEQQVGGMAEDSRPDHADRDAGDAEQDHRRGRPALRRQAVSPAGSRSP